ncbi:hypothetical protein RUND412_004594 [Rhizina undulata]
MPPNGENMRESTSISSHESVAADYSSHYISDKDAACFSDILARIDAVKTDHRATEKLLEHRSGKYLKKIDTLRKLVRQTNQSRKSRRMRQKLKQVRSILRQLLSSGGIVAGEQEAGRTFKSAKSSTMVAAHGNERSGSIKKDALDSSFQAMIDNSDTAVAHPRRNLVPTRGGLKPRRALHSSAGTRGGAVVVPAVTVSRESSTIEVEAVEKPQSVLSVGVPEGS